MTGMHLRLGTAGILRTIRARTHPSVRFPGNWCARGPLLTQEARRAGCLATCLRARQRRSAALSPAAPSLPERGRSPGVGRCVPRLRLQSALPAVGQSGHSTEGYGGSGSAAARRSPPRRDRDSAPTAGSPLSLVPRLHSSRTLTPELEGDGENCRHSSPPRAPASAPTPNPKTRARRLARSTHSSPPPPSVPAPRSGGRQRRRRWLLSAPAAAVAELGLVPGALGQDESRFAAAQSSA